MCRKIRRIIECATKELASKCDGSTDATVTMPEECKVELSDSVASYRKYYIMKKKRFATWKTTC